MTVTKSEWDAVLRRVTELISKARASAAAKEATILGLRSDLISAQTALQSMTERARMAADGRADADRQLREAEAMIVRLEKKIEALVDSGAVVDPKPDPPKVDPPVIVDPPVTGGGSYTPWTHAHIGISPEAAKLVIPPGYDEIQAGGGPRTPFRGRLDLELGGSHDLGDIVIGGTEKYYSRSMFSAYRAEPPGEPTRITMENIRSNIEGRDPKDLENFLRIARLYNVTGFVARNCQFVGIYHNGRQRPIEHALYVNMVDSTLIEGCLFQDLGGRGVYLPHRDAPYEGRYPPDNRPYTSSPTHTMASCRLIDTEMDAARGGYMDTIFDGGSLSHPGVVERRHNVIVGAWPFEREQGDNEHFTIGSGQGYRPVRCGGGFMHNSFQQFGSTCLDLYRRSHELIVMVQGNAEIGIVRNAKRVQLEHSCIEAYSHRNPYIDAGSQSSADPGKQAMADTVVIENCVSSSGVQVRCFWGHGEQDFDLMPMHTPGIRLTWTRSTREITREATA